MEFHGDVSFLKGGLFFADQLTTVSPTYAREITAPDNGMGLDGVLRVRAADAVRDPQRHRRRRLGPRRRQADPQPVLATAPGPARWATKRRCRRGWASTVDPDALLLGVVSRLTSQKGLDLLVPRIGAMVDAGMQLVVLGTGEPSFQHAFTAAAATWPHAVACVIGYDETLAHLIQAGTDALLVPSRFEPCGLTQLCALRYGNIPVVSRVGGLADSVIDANEAALAAGVATGLQFAPVTEEALWQTLMRLQRLWRNRKVWERMQRNAMAADVSWRTPADHYAVPLRRR